MEDIPVLILYAHYTTTWNRPDLAVYGKQHAIELLVLRGSRRWWFPALFVTFNLEIHSLHAQFGLTKSEHSFPIKIHITDAHKYLILSIPVTEAFFQEKQICLETTAELTSMNVPHKILKHALSKYDHRFTIKHLIAKIKTYKWINFQRWADDDFANSAFNFHAKLQLTRHMSRIPYIT